MTPGSFKKSKVAGSETLGEKFKKVREHNRLDIKEISEELQVRVKYLELLEQGHFDRLPADVYVRGILKNYAGYLGIPVDQALKLYDKERDVYNNVKESEERKEQHKTGTPKVVITPRTIKVILVIFIALGFFIYLLWQVVNLTSAPELTIISPAADETIDSSTLDIVGNAEPETIVTINGQQIGIERDGSFRETVSLQEGINIVRISAVNKLGRETVIERNVLRPGGEEVQYKEEDDEDIDTDGKELENENAFTLPENSNGIPLN